MIVAAYSVAAVGHTDAEYDDTLKYINAGA
ncbi:hypothetical protein EV650_3122 [Kribbella kalugense]|uniref:Uncharacterized protein n=1 Tax=Kribbella kalugense TaxID=2512221 RepID=A0A4R8A7E1_9ACTN|nr:hypothetical protein EV650_3122 [Kribbella kalugense]